MSFICTKCGDKIDGTNCTHTLCQKMDIKSKQCITGCQCGYPIRAKEVRNKVFTNQLDSDKKTKEPAYIYCETDKGQGHTYYGTYNECFKGNGLSASGMSSCKIFERYSSTK